MQLSATQQTTLDNALALVAVVGPALGPGGLLAAGIVSIATTAIKSATNEGRDVTDAELNALFDQFEVNKLADLQAQREARARGDTSGSPVPDGPGPVSDGG